MFIAGYDQDVVMSDVLTLWLIQLFSDIAPVLEGAVQHIASKRFELGGTELTKLFAQELGKTNPSMNLSMSDVEKLKEQYANCAEDEIAYKKTQNCEIEQHTLPDGQVCVKSRFYILCCYLIHIDNKTNGLIGDKHRAREILGWRSSVSAINTGTGGAWNR